MEFDKEKAKGVEAAIRDSIEKGEFENLKGKGKPLDLDGYFDAPEDIRLGYSIMKNAGYIPEEVDLLNQISELKEQLKKTTDNNKRKDLKKKIIDVQLKYDLRMERIGRK
jgi:hypothetical protein